MVQRRGTGSVRRGFSLAELIVSIGLLGLMMSLAGKIFSLSIESTGQATSLINVSKSLRLLEESLRNDLCGVDPDRSMLVIQGNPINAYWTADDAAVDGDEMPTDDAFDHAIDPEREFLDDDGLIKLAKPRADILMLFTSRKTTSAVRPQVSSNFAHVVYGHAALGELQVSSGDIVTWKDDPVAFPADPNEFFEHPAEGWHLARRAVTIVDATKELLNDALSLVPPIDELPGLPSDPGIREGAIDILDASFDLQSEVFGLITEPPPEWYERSQLDVSPPAAAAERLAHYFLPKCANFKVEWTPIGPGRLPKYGGINLREMLWLDPSNTGDWGRQISEIQGRIDPNNPPILGDEDDPRNQLDDLLVELNGLAIRTTDSATSIWFSRDPGTGAGDVPDPLWPTALRVTVDVFDGSGKFTRPVHHVMVIPVGGGS